MHIVQVRTIEVEGRQVEAVQAGEHADLTLQVCEWMECRIHDPPPDGFRLWAV